MLNILIVSDFNVRHINTIEDHLQSFKRYSSNNINFIDYRAISKFKSIFINYDVIVLHYSLIIASKKYFNDERISLLSKFKGIKVLYIQDEYRWVNATANAISELNINLIFTVINEESVDKVYCQEKIKDIPKITTLTGFVPEHLIEKEVIPFESRNIDIGYRARKVPAWLGRFGQEKWLIGQRIKKELGHTRLVLDIEHEERKRIYGQQWIEFVSNCKAMLGTESGASVIDYTGDIQKKVEAYELSHPDEPFETIYHKYLSGYDGNVLIHVISPRVFEASALRTLMILYPGEYSGILVPWKHYIPLKKDHSNIEDVIRIFNDPHKAQKIIDCSYEEIALNPDYTFKHMVEEFDKQINHYAQINPYIDNTSFSSSNLSDIENKAKKYYSWVIRPSFLIKRSIMNMVYFFINTFVRKEKQQIYLNNIKLMINSINKT